MNKAALGLLLVSSLVEARPQEFEGRCVPYRWAPGVVPIVSVSAQAAATIIFPETYEDATPGDPDNWPAKTKATSATYAKTVIIRPAEDAIEAVSEGTLTVIGESGNVYVIKLKNTGKGPHPSCYMLTASNLENRVPQAVSSQAVSSEEKPQKASMDEVKRAAYKSIFTGYKWKGGPVKEVFDNGRETIIRVDPSAGPMTIMRDINGTLSPSGALFDPSTKQFTIRGTPPNNKNGVVFVVKQGEKEYPITQERDKDE